MDKETQPTKAVQYISTFAEEAEHNFVAYLLHCGYVPGITVFNDDELVGIFSRITGVASNSVVRTHLSGDDTLLRIDEVMSVIRRNGVPAGWWIWPLTRPQNLVQILTEYGFSETPEVYPWMALKLSSLPAMTASQFPPRFTVERVQDRETLHEWLQVQSLMSARRVGHGSHLVAESLALQDLQDRLDFSSQAPLRCYLGRLDGRPVGALSTFIDRGGVGVYSIGVVPDERSEELNSILALVPLYEARNAGCQIATLMIPRREDYSLYEHLGFREVCRAHVQIWLPPQREGLTP